MINRRLPFLLAILLPAPLPGRAEEFAFTRDVAPIIQARCADCHRSGESGPFSLQTYDEVRRRARTIAAVVQDRYMPPWHAIGGDIPLLGDRRLTPAEIDTLLAWIANGTPEGDPAHLPAPRVFPAGWRLGQPDLILEMDESFALPPVFGAFTGINIAPGEANAGTTDSFRLPVPVEAFGATAHAHYLGKSLRLVAELPDGSTRVLLNVPDWDFSWQEEYRFAGNISLPAGTLLTSTVTWDNSSANSDNPVLPPVRVRWGRESFDEMGSLMLLVSTATKADSKTLHRRYSEHLAWQAGGHLVSPEKLKFASELRESALARFDNDGELDNEERARARAHLDAPGNGRLSRND